MTEFLFWFGYVIALLSGNLTYGQASMITSDKPNQPVVATYVEWLCFPYDGETCYFTMIDGKLFSTGP